MLFTAGMPAQDTLDIMKAEKAGEIGGVIHCFSYGTEMAREYLNMGFYLGIGGVVTFNNGRKLKEVVEYSRLTGLFWRQTAPIFPLFLIGENAILFESSLCGRSDQPDKRHLTGRGDKDHQSECKKSVSAVNPEKA